MYCVQISAENMQFRQSYGLKSKIFKSCGRVLARTFVGHAFLWTGGDGARPGTWNSFHTHRIFAKLYRKM